MRICTEPSVKVACSLTIILAELGGSLSQIPSLEGAAVATGKLVASRA